MEKQPKIHFLTPCYGGQITEVCFSSYLQWTIMAMQNGLDFQIDTHSVTKVMLIELATVVRQSF